jgi:hypothetical protein
MNNEVMNFLPVRIQLRADPSMCVVVGEEPRGSTTQGLGLVLQRCAEMNIRAGTDSHQVQWQMHHERELFRLGERRLGGVGRRIRKVPTLTLNTDVAVCTWLVPLKVGTPEADVKLFSTNCQEEVTQELLFDFDFDPALATAAQTTSIKVSGSTHCVTVTSSEEGAALGLQPCDERLIDRQQFVLAYATDGGASVLDLPEYPDQFNDNHVFCDIAATGDKCCLDNTLKECQDRR